MGEEAIESVSAERDLEAHILQEIVGEERDPMTQDHPSAQEVAEEVEAEVDLPETEEGLTPLEVNTLTEARDQEGPRAAETQKIADQRARTQEGQEVKTAEEEAREKIAETLKIAER